MLEEQERGELFLIATLHLASGYWQIRVHPDSREKTAPQEFRVMPFGMPHLCFSG